MSLFNEILLFSALFGGFLAWGAWLHFYGDHVFRMRKMTDAEFSMLRAFISSETFRNYRAPILFDEFGSYQNTGIVRQRTSSHDRADALLFAMEEYGNVPIKIQG